MCEQSKVSERPPSGDRRASPCLASASALPCLVLLRMAPESWQEAKGSYGDTRGASRRRSIPPPVRAHAAKRLDILVLFTPSLDGLLYTRTGALLLLLPTRRLELPNPAAFLLSTLHADALSSRPTPNETFATLHNAHIQTLATARPRLTQLLRISPLDTFRIVP